MSEAPVAAEGGGEPAAAPAARTGWGTFRSVLLQLAIFYFISSYFRGGKQTAAPPTNPDGTPSLVGRNLFFKDEKLNMYVFLTEEEDFDFNEDMSKMVWNEDIEYGNWYDGPNSDGTWTREVTVPVPDGVQQNGTWIIHVFIAKDGYPLNPSDSKYKETTITYQSKLFNRYRKRRVHNTANLLTGQSDVAPGSLKVEQGKTNAVPEIISYCHPNLTINLVDDYTVWTRGSVPQPVNKYVEFDDETGGYYPVLYINEYWNLAQDYMPLNDTVTELNLTLTYEPLSLFRFNMYASMTRDNPWASMMGGVNDQSDEDQDTIKTTLLDTNPYLLGLTVAVSILHSVFDFLAFKNDVQFWRNRKSLEGLSVRSVFFNVFQSFVVLLYILDNETNFVIIVSVFIGLLIELWKITKVVDIRVDWSSQVLGLLPRVSFVDRESYTESSTKKYDMLAFKYLGVVLFPLFLCYAVYSLLYNEHKGWYSFVLNMAYGFLLTFGFIAMTPQLFINYKLKSVAHLPWRMLTYKALNTFIDDLFAFVIKMPTLYRLGVFRDDIVFFIFLYQRWIYRVDPKRVNEFGTTGEGSERVAEPLGGSEGEENGDPPITETGEEPVKNEQNKKDD